MSIFPLSYAKLQHSFPMVYSVVFSKMRCKIYLSHENQP